MVVLTLPGAPHFIQTADTQPEEEAPMTEVQIECTAAIVQAIAEENTPHAAVLPDGYHVLTKAERLMYWVGTPEGDVFLVDATELDRAWQ